MAPESWFMDRSRTVSFERVPTSAGISPLRLLELRLIWVRFGKDEKLKLSSLPCRPALGRFICVTLPALLHDIPTQRHWVWLGAQDERDWV